MKKWIALVCAGMMAAALCGCSQTAGTASEEASAEPTITQTESAAASAEESAATEEVSAEPSAAESAVSTASAETSGETSAEADATGDVAGEIDSAVATEITGLLESGDFTAALTAAEEAGSESLTTQLQALADAAEACNVTKEPNSGDIIVYGDDGTVVNGTTNVIPFVDMTYDYTHLQIGYVEPAADAEGATPTSVKLSTADDSWTWDADTTDTVKMTADDSSTWVLETPLTGDDLALISAVGSAAPGEAKVQFSTDDDELRDYTLSDAEIGAFEHMGAFVSALQAVKDTLAA